MVEKSELILKTRESRLFKTPLHYIWESGKTIINIFLLYKSSSFFTAIALILFLGASGLVIRYLLLIRHGAPSGIFWPTIVLAGVLLLASLFVFLSGIFSSLIAANRKLSEEILYKLRKFDFTKLKRRR